MCHRTVWSILILWVAIGGMTVALADDLSSAKDLAATIALHGKPCDQVTDVKRIADSSYIASCKDGNRYHVFVSPQGRVIVEKQ